MKTARYNGKSMSTKRSMVLHFAAAHNRPKSSGSGLLNEASPTTKSKRR